MKILAVIPARAGSVGIPNKNIRLIGGKPMIYYSLDNARKSEYITDIVVTTDSPEVEIVAQQMGISVHHRSAELCDSKATLDGVIYDAAKDREFDYVVTMQPTSPTLKTSTLDAAIKYAIENDLDTVISAINAPHLSWGRDENGNLKPNYEKRLNRQYLPPNYMETGAFVVTNRRALKPGSRIGTKVEVFEIGSDEAVDIDNFQDLRTAEYLLGKKTVAFYVNGNNTRGTGHVYRALELSDEFYVKPDIYYDINQTNPAIFGSTTHNLIPVNGIGELFGILREKQYDIFINDILTTSIDYMIALRQAMPNAKIINFEDDGEGAYHADLVFNALFNNDNHSSKFHCGERYFIAAKMFMMYEPIAVNDEVKNVFISFGGADPQNYSDRLLEIIRKPEYAKYNFTVVLGRAKHNVQQLMEYNKYENITVYHDVKNMPALMAACDVAVTSRGRTSYELALLGIPSIVMAQNKREESHGFVINENGFIYLGLNPNDRLIESNLNLLMTMDKESREDYHSTLLKNDLRGGRHRVVSLINDL